MSSKHGVLAIALLALAGCLGTTDVEITRVKYAFLVVSADTTSEGAVSTVPVGTFFKSSPLSFVDPATITDSCVTQNYIAPTTDSPGLGLDYVDAGDSITVALGADTVGMPRTTLGGDISYVTRERTPINYTPGDSVTFTIPGVEGGFPAITVKGRTAEEPVFDTIPVPSGDSIHLVWQAPTTMRSSAMMFVSLQYTPQAGGPRQEIFCRLKDDGEYYIDALHTSIDPWRLAQNDRTAVATRWRVRYDSSLLMSDNAAVSLLSTFAAKVPVAAP